ncbi:MAG: ABC transporter permease subunit [Clostridiales bacterium]|nr:ABC transporter permease subunit [Clostridiales bacterium]MDD6872477.1 ABC transporter permease subunit [Clostridiales bacterium]MDD7366994.1 ABC transporter permease subunit [Clostridiales bacterium]MDY2872510.1 ABC transporter permease subunit [Eubacteriales bacterium]
MSQRQPARRKGFAAKLWDQRMLVLMSLPALLLVIVFQYIPLYGITIAFQRFNPIKGFFNPDIEWVGLKYFYKFFQTPYVFRLLRNNLIISLEDLLFGFPLPIILAILLDQLQLPRYKKVVQTISYLPHFLSTVILVGLVKMIFAYDGIVNDVIEKLGGARQTFLISRAAYRPLFIGSGIWQEVGWGSIIYLAALTNADPQLMEAAIVDGATRFQRIVHVSIPAILPTISIQLIFRVSSILGVSQEKTILLYNESTYEVADVIGSYVYRQGIVGGSYEYTTAISLLMSIVSLVLITLANYTSRAISETSLW